MKKSEICISFNEEMISNLTNYIEAFNYAIIPQSVLCEETNFLVDNKREILKNLGISSEKKIILFPSGMRTVKDPLFVLNEICEFLCMNDDFVCILLGSIYDENLYEEIKAKTHDVSNFKISTSLERKDFIRLLKESSLVINSSICEGMSNVIMESLSLGVPVLARKNQGNAKLIKDNFNGYLFEDKEEFSIKLNILLGEEQENHRIRNLFIENGKNTILDNFSYENELSNYDRILNDILNRFIYKYQGFDLFFSKDTHPFSQENNVIFEVINYKLFRKLKLI